jgi:hypothetical protein
MQRICAPILGILLWLGPGTAAAWADWVELTNNDVVRGQVVSLDNQKLKLKSVNFGEMTIPRDKVKLIGFGERPVATAALPVGQGSQPLSSQLPSLVGNGQVNQLLQEALGGRDVGDLRQSIKQTKDGLKKLQQDLKSTPEAGALDSYIQMFDLLGNLVPQSNPQGPGAAPNQPAPKQPAGGPGRR